MNGANCGLSVYWSKCRATASGVASGEDEFPLALIVETHKGMKSFFSSTFSPGADLSKPGVLAAFEEAFWSGAARPNLKTAVVVNQAKADGTVYEMVGSEFGDLVLRSDKDVLLFFYAPWCGGCKQFKPKYEAAAVELSDQNTLLVARMDATQNQVRTSSLSCHEPQKQRTGCS